MNYRCAKMYITKKKKKDDYASWEMADQGI